MARRLVDKGAVATLIDPDGQQRRFIVADLIDTADQWGVPDGPALFYEPEAAGPHGVMLFYGEPTEIYGKFLQWRFGDNVAYLWSILDTPEVETDQALEMLAGWRSEMRTSQQLRDGVEGYLSAFKRQLLANATN